MRTVNGALVDWIEEIESSEIDEHLEWLEEQLELCRQALVCQRLRQHDWGPWDKEKATRFVLSGNPRWPTRSCGRCELSQLNKGAEISEMTPEQVEFQERTSGSVEGAFADLGEVVAEELCRPSPFWEMMNRRES